MPWVVINGFRLAGGQACPLNVDECRIDPFQSQRYASAAGGSHLPTRKGHVTKRKHHIAILAGLLGLSCLVQVVVIGRATVPALDAVRFVRIAQSIDRHGLLPTLRTEREQPLFPVWVWAVHGGVERVAGESADSWATAVQLAAAVSLVLTVVPLYFLVLRLAGRAAAMAAGLFFCLLPEVSRLGADGISDSTHLLFFSVALWAIVECFAVGGWGKAQRCPSEAGTGASLRSAASHPDSAANHPATLWLTLAGVATAAGLLARAEVAVLALALAATMIAFQFFSRRRQPWPTVALAGGGYLLGAAVVLGPYLAALGDLNPRAAVARVLGRYEVEETSADWDRWYLPGGEEAAFDLKERTISLRQPGYAAVGRFVRKLADGFGYWIGALALYGAWVLRRGGVSAADRFVQVFFVLFSAVAIRFATREGYLDARHVLTLVVAGMAAAGYGAVDLGRRIADRFTGGQTARTGRSLRWSVVAVASVACLPQVTGRLHENRQGHRAAAAWLATEADPPGAVLDTRGLTGFYSGRKTYTYAEARAALGDPCLAFVVLERRELHYDSPRARTLRWLIETAARPVGEFPDAAGRSSKQRPVLVYRWYPERLAAAIEKGL